MAGLLLPERVPVVPGSEAMKPITRAQHWMRMSQAWGRLPLDVRLSFWRNFERLVQEHQYEIQEAVIGQEREP